MKFASRLEKLPPYLFADLMRRIEAKRKLGVDVINLGSGDPDTPTCPEVVAAAHAGLGLPDNHRYPSNRGKPTFRAAAAQFMQQRFGVALDPDTEIAPALGGKEAVHHLAFLALDPGQVCLCPDPAYPIYASATNLAGGIIHVMPLEARNRFLPDLNAIPIATRREANLMFVNYPNNPTGAVAEAADFDRMIAFAKDNDVILVHDNAYSEIAFDGYQPSSFLARPGAKDVGVEIFSLSKGWNMTGWRISFVAGNQDVVGRFLHLKPNIDAGPFGAIQDAAIEAMSGSSSFPRSMSEIYQRRRDLMVGALREIGLQVMPPKATLFLWCAIPEGRTSVELANLILERVGVVVSPGSAFGRYGEGFIRIALTAPDGRLAEAADRIRGSIDLTVAAAE